MLEENPEIAPSNHTQLTSISENQTEGVVDPEKVEQTSNLGQSQIEENKQEPLKKEFKGLQNQGGTCYMNSLLQALFMTPEFRAMIFQWRYDPLINADKKDCILYQLQKLFAGLLTSKQPFVSTTGLTSSFQWDYKESFQQQDVQEFMRVLFDAIEQSFEINNIYGVVEDIYSGEGSDFIRCLECGYRSDRTTKFYDLQLPVKNEFENICNDSVEKAIFGYLKPEIMEGQNAYQCSGCNKKVKAQKGSRLVKLPVVLTLQLNRFTIDFQTWQRKKLNDKVSFPLVLNMNNFLDESKQSDYNLTEHLVKENPLLQVKPSHLKVPEVRKFKQEENKVISQVQGNFDEFLSQEIGNFDDSAAPAVKGTLAQKRQAEAKAKMAAHKKTVQNLKKVTEPKKKSTFDRSKLNSNFFTNSKASKDEVKGWAYDFDNPDAGKAKDDDIQLQQAIKQSLVEKESLSKSNGGQDQPNEELVLEMKHNHSADSKPETVHTETTTDSLTVPSPTIQTESPLLNNPVPDSQPARTREELIQLIKEQNKQLKSKYLLEGPFVYELFACLVHQGGALGGHYYAYIKDNESAEEPERWFNFNDYRVTDCDLIELSEMFGGNKGKSVQQTTNAYMLMYRLCRNNQSEVQKFELSDIPQDVLDEVTKQDSQVNKSSLAGDTELKSQRMQLKIVRHSLERGLSNEMEQKVVFVDRREDTYNTLLLQVFSQFCISAEDWPNYRLRAYNVQNKIMMETYIGMENLSLESLKIYPMKTLILEQKAPGTQFLEYDPTSMIVKINIWREGITSLSEDILNPTQISVAKDLPMTDFLSVITQKFGIAKPLVMKRNPMLNQRQLEILSQDKSLSQLRVNEGVNLFIEDQSNLESNSTTSQWEHEFDLDQNRLQVKFNRPSESQAELNYKEFLLVDRRISVLDLKIKIAEFLALDISNLVFRRGGTHGVELVEDDQTLKNAQFYNMICVQVKIGIPTQVGQKRLKIYLAQDYKLGQSTEDFIIRDNIYFNISELAEIPINTAQTVLDVKKQIIQKIGAIEGNGFKITQQNIDRALLREKQGDDKLTQVYHDDRIFYSYQIHDGKEIALQFLLDEDLPSASSFTNHYLCMVKLWKPSLWTLSSLCQIFVPKVQTLHDFSVLLSQKFNIQCQNVQVCKIASSWNFSRIQLPHENWQNLHQNNSFIASAPFYVNTDGLLFIVKDSQEGIRPLNDDEELLYNTAQLEQNQFTNDKAGFKKSSVKTIVKEQGVKITVKKAQTESE